MITVYPAVEAVVAQGHNDSNATVVDSIPTKDNKLLFINIFISSLAPMQKPGVEFRQSRKCLKTRFPMPTLIR